MKHLVVLYLFAFSLSAAVTVDIVGATATQAVIAVRGCYDGITLSNLIPYVNDWDQTKFANADKASAHNNTVGLYTGYTVLTIGQRTNKIAGTFTVFDLAVEPRMAYSLALQTTTRYSGTVTCAAGTTNFSFQTSNIPWGGARREPFQSDGKGNFLGTDGSVDDVNDSITGVRHTRFIGKKDMIAENWPNKFEHDAAILDYTVDVTNFPPGGIGWTTPANVSGAGGWASTSGNEFLRVSFGRNYPQEGTIGNRVGMSWINAWVTGHCEDSGDGSCAAGGNMINACFTNDGVACSTRLSRIALPLNTDAKIAMCGPENTNPDTTGCIPAKQGMPDSWGSPGAQSFHAFYPNAATSLYNSGNSATANFYPDNSDCLKLHPGDVIAVWNGSLVTLGISSGGLNCASSPPAVTFTSAIDLSFNHGATPNLPAANGTLGVPFYFPLGIEGNTRAGFLFRKEAGVAGTVARPNAIVKISRIGYSGGTYAPYIPPSGGHQQICQPVAGALGYYPCVSQTNQAIYGFKPNPDGSLSAKFFGTPYEGLYGGARFCGSGQIGDFVWDQYIPGRFYCSIDHNDGGTSLYRNDMWSSVNANNNLGMKDKACGEPGSGCAQAVNWGVDVGGRWPIIPQGDLFNGGLYDLNPTAAVAGFDYSFQAQIANFDPTFDRTLFGGCAINFIVDHYGLGSCTMGAQDALGWLFAFDLGNGLPIYAGYTPTPGAPGRPSLNGFPQQIVAAMAPWRTPPSRWAGNHTLQNTSGGPTVMFMNELSDGSHSVGQGYTTQLQTSAMTNFNGGAPQNGIPICTLDGNCDTCPAATMPPGALPYNSAGSKRCTTITVTSAYPWGTPPAGYATGEPVSPAGDAASFGTNPLNHFLQAVQAGDYADISRLSAPDEIIRIIQKISPAQWIVQRSIGYGVTPNAYPINTPITMHNVTAPDTNSPAGGGAAWYPLLSLNGADPAYYFADTYQNHAVQKQPNFSQASRYFISKQQLSDAAGMKTRMNDINQADVNITFNGGPYPFGTWFSGKSAPNQGAAVENHPSCGQAYNPATAYEWCSSAYIDEHPLLNAFGNANTADSVWISGNLWKYVGVNDPDGLNRKHFVSFAMSGTRNLANVSGPASVITGTASDLNKFCIAERTNECVPGSAAGDIYYNAGLLDPQRRYCNGGDAWDYSKGICVGDAGAPYGVTDQVRVPAITGASAARAPYNRNYRTISTFGKQFRGSTTANTRLTPDARFLFEGDYMAVMPPLPVDDGIDRMEFIPFPVTLKPPVGLGIDNAIVTFGYNLLVNGAQDLFFCSENRPERCVANSAVVDRNNPYLWPTVDGAGGVEAGITGVPCASGCVVVAPAISQKILYYKWKYRDAAGNILSESQVQVAAIP